MPKRKMRPPGDLSSTSQPGLPQMDQLFSQLFGSVLNPNQVASDPASKWADMLKNSAGLEEGEDDEGDEDESGEDEEGEEGEDEGDCDHPECHPESNNTLATRWKTLQKLVQSHEILIRSFDALNKE